MQLEAERAGPWVLLTAAPRGPQRKDPALLLQPQAFSIHLCISKCQTSLPGCTVGTFKCNLSKNEFISSAPNSLLPVFSVSQIGTTPPVTEVWDLSVTLSHSDRVYLRKQQVAFSMGGPDNTGGLGKAGSRQTRHPSDVVYEHTGHV